MADCFPTIILDKRVSRNTVKRTHKYGNLCGVTIALSIVDSKLVHWSGSNDASSPVSDNHSR